MKVITTSKPYFKIIPRFLSGQPILEFENKMIVAYQILEQKNILKVIFTNTTLFVEGQNYSFTIKSISGIIYKGKLMFVKTNTNLQNYSAQTQDTKRWT